MSNNGDNIHNTPSHLNHLLQHTGTKAEVLDWLVGLAVRLEYGEKAEVLKKVNKEYLRNQRYVM